MRWWWFLIATMIWMTSRLQGPGCRFAGGTERTDGNDAKR